MIITSKKMRPRERHDHYPTPSGLCRAALDLLPADADPSYALDPGAGTGVWGAAVRARWGRAPTITGVELQASPRPAAYDYWHCRHFTAYAAFALRQGLPRPTLIVGNPPYRWAEAFIRLSLAMLEPGGYLLQLLRLNFLEGQSRAEGLWATHGPIAVDTLARRPSYTGDMKTDATAYALFLWQKENYPRRHSGGWLSWQYGQPTPEDRSFRPFLALPLPPELRPPPPPRRPRYEQQVLALASE